MSSQSQVGQSLDAPVVLDGFNSDPFTDARLGHHHEYILPALKQVLDGLRPGESERRRVFDLGCGNGSVARWLGEMGFDVVGVDPLIEGDRKYRLPSSSIELYNGSAYDDVAGMYGQFPVVISLEVIEHIYSPRRFAAALFDLVAAGGVAVVSTPYHGYWKNLALALTGKMDQHHAPLWDDGHIKFWSKESLGRLLLDAGFIKLRFKRIGRFPILAKSMIVVAQK